MTFNFIFRQGLPGTYLYQTNTKKQIAAAHHLPIFRYFHKDIFLEVPDEK